MEYLDSEKVIEFNFLALTAIKAKKADQPKVLSKAKIEKVLGNCERKEGDVFDKAVVLLEGLVKAHAFDSGNRRTAFISMKYFLILNKKKTKIKDDPKNSRTMLGIRESHYSHEEIKEWIKNGKIKEFKR
jgi:death-on-curing family protein